MKRATCINAQKEVMRHEIVHAFLYESGLGYSTHIPNCAWAVNEEMVDWIAIQTPKMAKVFKQAGCSE
jgi:predicted SprT family Zn-dependent metalloprotease